MQNENKRNHVLTHQTPKQLEVYPVVCWLYSCVKVLQCKYNAQDNVDCDFLSSSACAVNMGPHILLWYVCPFCWSRMSYIAKSGGIISEHSQKQEKWFTVFWTTIRFIWFDCCCNMLDFQKCGVLCNQWEVPLQICVLQTDVSHPLFAQTLHQRSKLAKCTFSKIYLKDFLNLNWTSCCVFVFLNSTFYGSIRHWSMVCTCHALSWHCSCQVWFLWDQQALKQNSRDIYILFCTLIWAPVLPNVTVRSFIVPVQFSKTHSTALSYQDITFLKT
jgi:hypothetical protein